MRETLALRDYNSYLRDQLYFDIIFQIAKEIKIKHNKIWQKMKYLR